MNDTAGIYLWIKAFHLIAVIAWMVGLLYGTSIAYETTVEAPFCSLDIRQKGAGGDN